MAKMSTLQVILEAIGFETRSYCGRAMYGKKCLAVVTSQFAGELFAGILCGISESDDPMISMEEIHDAVEGMKSDSMGHDYVYYFPDVKYIDEDEDEITIQTDGDSRLV